MLHAKTAVVLSCACLAGAVALPPAATAGPARHGAAPTLASRGRGHRGACQRPAPQLPAALRPAPAERAHTFAALSRGASPNARQEPSLRAPGRSRATPWRSLTPPRAATLASVLASLLATPCQNTELMPEPGNLALIRAAVLCLINRVRAQNDERPLTPSGQLEQAAEGHSRGNGLRRTTSSTCPPPG